MAIFDRTKLIIDRLAMATGSWFMAQGQETAHQQTPNWTLAVRSIICKRTCTQEALVISFDIIFRCLVIDESLMAINEASQIDQFIDL